VLLPKPGDGSVGKNAERQWQGFSKAFEDNTVDKNDWKTHRFAYPTKGKELEDIETKIEEWYEDGVRIFIITMSGAVISVKEKFKSFAAKQDEGDRPILVATVASAPKLVSPDDGVFRHYVRSRDEADVLATFIETLENPFLGVFFVDDDYGDGAVETLDERLDDFFARGIRLQSQEEDIEKSVVEFLSQANNAHPRSESVAVIVGYGPMINSIIMELQRNAFEGQILAVSTFTEAAWRPASLDQSLKERIHTVGTWPVAKTLHDRGVVYQFSYLTLDRALNCRDHRGVEALWQCFRDAEPNKTWATVEFTDEGDSHVSLRLLDHNEW
jgi:hypothetical protein